jgi:hypothetical protein
MVTQHQRPDAAARQNRLRVSRQPRRNVSPAPKSMRKQSKTEHAEEYPHARSPGAARFRENARNRDARDITLDLVVQLDGESCSGSEDDRDVMAALDEHAQQRLMQE